MNAKTPPPPPGAPMRARETRDESVQRERRRRDDFLDYAERPRLFLDASKLDMRNFTYRWLNDQPGRVHTLTTADDWEPVNETEVNGPVEYPVGYTPDGKALMSRLVKKPRKWHDVDQAKKQAKLDAEMQEILRAPPSDDKNPGADLSTAYVRDGNSLSSGVTTVRGSDAPLAD